MENKKDIGKAFREKLDGLQKQPSDAAWNSISAELRQMKKPSKFPWLRTSIVSVVIAVVVTIATYPLWESHVPRIYIEMPDGHKTEAGRNGDLKSGTMENNATSVTATDADSDTTENVITTGNVQDNPDSISKSHRNVSPVAGMPVNNSPSGTEHGSSNTTSSEGNTIPVKDTGRNTQTIAPVTTTNPGKENKTPADNDESEGKVKMLDLSGISYGTDNLKTKEEKKKDYTRIADSLNKLYGREKKDKKSEKKKN
jgi:hypothetical protein